MSIPRQLETIVILNDFGHERGGADQVAIRSAIGLAEHGCRVLFFCAVAPVDPRLLAHPLIEVLCLGEPELLVRARSVMGPLRGLWNPATARILRRRLAVLDPAVTVVHAHCYTKALTASCLHESLAAGFRTVLTLHDYFLSCPNGAFFEYPASRSCDRSPLGMDCLLCRCDARSHSHKLWRFARGLIQNRLARIPERLTAAIVLGNRSRTLAARHLPASCTLLTIPNPVDAEPLPPLAPQASMPVLFIGRLEAYKGVFLLAKAARRTGTRVVFCGDGSAAARLRQEYPEFDYRGTVPHALLRGTAAGCRALAFPSLWQETFGLTALEAMAWGLPPIVARDTAPAERISHGLDGLLFESGSIQSLGEALMETAREDRALSLGREAYRHYWLAPCSLGAHVDLLLTHYAMLPLRPQLGTSM